jgi:aryl-alcohol dehydrogenase-like predicted oxidoreductase
MIHSPLLFLLSAAAVGETLSALALRFVIKRFLSCPLFSPRQRPEAEHLLPSLTKSETAAQTYQRLVTLVG